MFLNGGYVALTQTGEGEDVLLLHGYLSDRRSFYYQINHLSKNYKVTAPDIIGFGASSPLSEAYSLDDYCRWLGCFIKKCKLNAPIIIAHSFGARMALKYLSQNETGARALIITGGAGLVKPRSKEYLRKVRAYRRVKRIFPKFAEKHFGSEEYRALPPVMRESYKKIVNEDLKECAKKISAPTLLIYGDSDAVTPADEEGLTFHSLIKGSKLAVISGGHFCFSDNPEVFNGKVDGFLNTL